jgi:hypothetical protein
MTDHIIFDILYSTEDKFKEARELLNRIFKRELYRIVDSKNLSAEFQVKNIHVIPCITQHGVQITEFILIVVIVVI